MSPEGTGIGKGFDCWPSPDGKWVTARQGDDKLALYPVGSGEPRFIDGLVANDRMAGWSADSRSLYVQTLNPEWPIRVSRLDVETGRRETWKDLMPPDAAGVDPPQGPWESGSPPMGSSTCSASDALFGALRRGSSPIGRLKRDPHAAAEGSAVEKLKRLVELIRRNAGVSAAS